MKEWQYEGKQESGNTGFEPDAEMSAEFREECRKARDKGLYYLQFSSKTEDEMRKKLAEQGFSPAFVADAVNFLKSYRYLDDEDYVRRYLERFGKKKSEKQIKFDLRQKGIPADIIERVLEDAPIDESEQILALLEKKKFSGSDADREERAKMTAFLARKGFSYDAISKAMNQCAEYDTV